MNVSVEWPLELHMAIYDSNVTIINPSILVTTVCESLSSIHHINLFNSEHVSVFILYIDNS